MSRLILILVGIVVLLPVLLIGGLMLLLANPDVYRDRLSTAFADATGYELDIGGDIGWRYLPPIAITVGNVSVTPAGASEHLARVRSADVDLALFPLLFGGEIAIAGFTVQGLEINAIVDENGRGNWELPADHGTATSDPAALPESSDEELKLDIDGISVLDTVVTYQDLAAGSDYRIEIPAITIGPLRPGAPTAVDFEVNVDDRAGGMTAQATGDGTITIAPDFSRLSFADLSVEPAVTLPEMAAIRLGLTLNGHYDVAASRLETSLDGRLDSSRLQGTASVTTADLTSIVFDVTLDQLNVDSYLSADDSAAEAGSAAPEDVEILPLETLRDLVVDGNLAIGTLTWDTWTLGNFTADIENRDQRLMANLGMSSFGGTLGVTFNGSTRGSGAGQTDIRIDGVDLAEMTGFDWITGTIAMNSSTTFVGHRLSDLMKTLDGPTTFDIADGTLDVTPVKRIAAMVDTLRGEPSRVAGWPDRMPFEVLEGTHRFVGGTARNQQLQFALDVLSARGTGGFQYFDNTLEYDLVLSMSENEGPFSVGPGLARLDWPLHCEGALDASPVELCFPNRDAIQRVIGSVAKQELKRKATEAIEKIKVPEGLEGARDALKRLFNP